MGGTVGERPAITRVGDAAVVHAMSEGVYVDPGATADDEEDGVITLDIEVGGDTVDSTSPGIYTITYNVVDSDGNSAIEVKRTVEVVDDVVPVMTLIGDAEIEVGLDETYVDAGAAASDNFDGDITADIVVAGTVDTSVLATYTVTYTVSDAAGNAATAVTRTVYIVDDAGPVVTVIDDVEVLLAVGGTYVEMGATARDGVDGTLANVVIGGDTVNTSAAGIYVVEYTVTDSVGNSTVATRTVTVDAALATYVVSVEYNYWPLNAARLDVGDITISVSGQTRNLTAENGQLEFALADDGTTYVYEVADTRADPEYETVEVSSSAKDVTITLSLFGAEDPPGPGADPYVESSALCFIGMIAQEQNAGNSSRTFLPAGVIGGLALMIFMSIGGKMRRFFSLTAVFLGLLIVAAPSAHANGDIKEVIYNGSSPEEERFTPLAGQAQIIYGPLDPAMAFIPLDDNWAWNDDIYNENGDMGVEPIEGYLADNENTITFLSGGHDGSYNMAFTSVPLPEDNTRAKGDFEYTMDLATTDLDFMGSGDWIGWNLMGISVCLQPEVATNCLSIYQTSWLEGAHGGWTAFKSVESRVFDDPDLVHVPDLKGEGAGDMDIKITKTGNVMMASYKLSGGDWAELTSVNLDTHQYNRPEYTVDTGDDTPKPFGWQDVESAGDDVGLTPFDSDSRWTMNVFFQGMDGLRYYKVYNVVNEISVKFTPLLEPTITLADDGNGGDQVDYIAVGSTYADLGVTAVGAPPDLLDITDDIVVTGTDVIDTSVAGRSFIVTYSATDPVLLTQAVVTRRVTVVEDEAPVLTLKSETMGDTDFEIMEGGAYTILTAALTDPTSTYFTNDGATAIDWVDGDITTSIVVGGDTLDTETPGSYTITYSITDSGGFTATDERTVTVTARPEETPDARGAAGGDTCFIDSMSADSLRGSHAMMLLLLTGSILACLIGGLMKKHRLRLIALLVGAGLVFTGIPSAFAQEDADVFTLDEITVTAERRETSAQDTPVAVSAWDNTALDEEAINGIEDLQMRMPSTQFTANKIVMRGVGRDLNQLGMDPGVGIYEDGFYSTEQGALGNLFDVARIEAIRGPQSTLFGRNTIGGLVQIIYTRPTREFSGQAKIDVNPRGASQYLAFGGPLIEDKLMYRIRLRNWDTDGQQYNFYDGENHGGYDGSTVDAFLLYQPTDKLELYARYWFSTAQNDIGAGIYPDPYNACCTDIWYTYPGDSQATLVRTMDETGVVWTRNSDKLWGPTQYGGMMNPWWNVQNQHNPSSDDPWKNNFDLPGFFDFDGDGIQLTTTFEATDSLTIKVLTEYRDWWWTQHGDADGSANPGYGMEWDVPMSIYQYTGELQFIYGAPGGRVSFIGGLYYYFKHEVQGWIYSAVGTENTKHLYMHIENPNDEDNPPATADGWRPQVQTSPWTGPGTYFAYDTWINTGDTAVYGQVDFAITDKLNVTAGMRWAKDDKKGYERLDMINVWGTNAALYHYTAHPDDPNPYDYQNDPELYPPTVDHIQQLVDDGQTPIHGSGFLAGQDIQIGDPIELGPRRNAYGDNAELSWQYDKPSGTWNTWGDPFRVLGTETTPAEWARWVGKLSFDYKPIEETLLYISYAKGFKAGGFQLGSWAQGEADPAAFVNPRPGESIPLGEPVVYDPEELHSYEIGWKQLWFEDHWRTNLTVYMYDYDNLQVEVTVNNETGVRNSGDAEVLGVEFEGEGYVTDHLLVNWATSYTNAQYLGFQASDTAFPWEGVQNIDGNVLKRSPAYKFACGGTYTRPTDVGDFALNLRYYWQSETFFAQYNSWKDRYKAWDRVDARFWWNSPDLKWRASVGINNIFNTRGVMDVAPNGSDGRRQWTMISKREWSMELSYRF